MKGILLFGFLSFAVYSLISADVSKNITAIEGESIVFSCDIAFPTQDVQRSWTNKSRVIYANDNRLMRDKRISMVRSSNNDYSVKVHSVTVYDEGDYTCTVYSDNMQEYTQHLTVYVPPRLEKKSNDIIIDEGDTTILECLAYGKPKPKITWRHLIPSADGIRATSSFLPLAKVTRSNAGTYECTADNSVSAPVKGKINVVVNYSPELDRPNPSVVGNVLNTDVELICIASAVPLPKFTWHHPTKKIFRKDTTSIANRVRVFNIKKANTVMSKLIIKRTTMRDYGDYYCIASNIMGFANKTIKLERVFKQPTRPPPDMFFNLRSADKKEKPGNSSIKRKQEILAFVNFAVLFCLLLLLH